LHNLYLQPFQKKAHKNYLLGFNDFERFDKMNRNLRQFQVNTCIYCLCLCDFYIQDCHGIVNLYTQPVGVWGVGGGVIGLQGKSKTKYVHVVPSSQIVKKESLPELKEFISFVYSTVGSLGACLSGIYPGRRCWPRQGAPSPEQVFRSALAGAHAEVL
jgi:hypothetical protein